jgi:hypothetical protein
MPWVLMITTIGIEWDYSEGSSFNRIIRPHFARNDAHLIGGLRFGVFFGWACSLTFYDPSCAPPSKDAWYFYEHQSGGHGCWQYKFFIRPLDVTPEFLEFARQLVIDYDQYGNGWFEPDYVRPEDYSDYRQRLAACGLTIEEPLMKTFMEALYPIDFTAENLRRISRDTQALADVRAARDTLGSPSRTAFPPGIFILSDNSD